ncbi:universal stress protein [Gramella sp. AN32]|uniref:Universal stress protein n=1 Tax=Christiangramia antarctica TaxID=2058158 RepID=A0ABW5X4X9_9FLAO|nr:universal stress protein [Gramella sp. AN32]MCM4158095.1 universal stress protein [Gramella sp. AN32]
MKTITIIIPIDFTEVSRNTVKYVLALAKKLRTKIVFVHAYTVAYPSSTPIGMGTMAVPISENQESQEKLNESKLQEFIDSFPELTSIDYKSYVGFGTTVDVICQTAKDENANLIVMGTKGADSSIEEFFVGTVSEKVTRNAPCSVLVVPESIKFTTISHLGLALDEDSLENDVDLDLLDKLLETFNANLHLVQITNENDAALNENEVRTNYKNFLGQKEFTFNIFQNEDPEKGINKFLSEKPIDVLALFYREHKFFERLFEKGLRKKLVFGSNIPLLVLK